MDVGDRITPRSSRIYGGFLFELWQVMDAARGAMLIKHETGYEEFLYGDDLR